MLPGGDQKMEESEMPEVHLGGSIPKNAMSFNDPFFDEGKQGKVHFIPSVKGRVWIVE